MRMNDKRWTEAVSDWIPFELSNALQEDHRPGGQSSSRKALEKDMMLNEFLEWAEPIGLGFPATGKSGGFTVACSSNLTINGVTGDS
uniref:BEACH domain-containing protein n=1 Tax=Angiostrongylus cantonensis TaxID=6313 RepID=A0A0K0DC70_ANGCA